MSHAARDVLRVAPVADGGEVTELERLLPSERDGGGGTCHLARQEELRPARRLVDVEDPAARVYAVALAHHAHESEPEPEPEPERERERERGELRDVVGRRRAQAAWRRRGRKRASPGVVWVPKRARTATDDR
jgi:hypothetical protein